MSKKSSRLDRVEKAMGEVARTLEAQGNAINYLLTEVNNMKVKDLEVNDEEQVKPEDENELIR